MTEACYCSFSLSVAILILFLLVDVCLIIPFAEMLYMFAEVVLNLHGLGGKENEHFLVNSGTVYFQQMGSFVMVGRSFSRKFAVE